MRATGHLRQIDVQLYARTAQGRDHIDQRRDAVPDIDDLGGQRLAAREGEQLRGQLGGAVGGVGDGVDLALTTLGGELGAAEQVDRAANDGEQVVEVMRDTARQLADRLQLLRLAQLFLGGAQRGLGRLLLGDVATDGKDLEFAGGADPGDPFVMTLGMAHPELDPRDAPFQRGAQRGSRPLPIVGVDEIHHRPADQVGRLIAQQNPPRRVDPADRPFGIDHGQQVRRHVPHPVALGGPFDDPLFQRDVQPAQLLQRLRQLRLALAQGGIGVDARGRLVGEDEQSGDLAFAVQHARIGEGPEGMRLAPVGIELPGQIDEALGPARQRIVDDRPRLFQRIGPYLVEARPIAQERRGPSSGKYVSLKKK